MNEAEAGYPPATGLVVAVDGPSGSGKSTISRRVAAELGVAYLDTGAMYRAATWWCVRRGIDLDDTGAVTQAVARMPLTMITDPTRPTVLVDGVKVEPEIRSPQISTVVSKIATNLDVRQNMKERQQALIAQAAAGRGIVAEGRDITTVIAPDARVRILLLADAEARLARRTAELYGTTDEEKLAATRDQVQRRDRDDATVSEFFTAADGVQVVDTSRLSFDESYEAVLKVVLDASSPQESRPQPDAQPSEHTRQEGEK